MKLISRKRRREGKTNYSKRIRLLEGKKPRLALRKTNKYIIIQYIISEAAQDLIKASIISKELINHGWPESESIKNLSAAYLTGYLFGKKIKNLEKPIVDLGLQTSTKGSKIYSAIKGLIDAGVNLACDEKMFPNKERIEESENFEKIKKSIDSENKLKTVKK